MTFGESALNTVPIKNRDSFIYSCVLILSTFPVFFPATDPEHRYAHYFQNTPPLRNLHSLTHDVPSIASLLSLLAWKTHIYLSRLKHHSSGKSSLTPWLPGSPTSFLLMLMICLRVSFQIPPSLSWFSLPVIFSVFSNKMSKILWWIYTRNMQRA